MKILKYTCSIVAIGGVISASPAFASDPFSISAVITNGAATQKTSASFSDVQQAINYFSTTNLQNEVSSYVDQPGNQSGVVGNISYLGAPVVLSFQQNNDVLTFNVPGINLTKTFTGTSRSDAVSQLVDFLKGNGGSILNQFQKYLATASPISPLAGNPVSLQSSLVGSSFTSTSFNTSGNTTSSSASGSRFGISVSAGQFSSGSFTGTAYTLPISYAYRFPNPRWQLQLNVPVTYQKIDGAATYAVQGGLGLQIPVLPKTDWYITPVISGGATGSLNLGSAGAMYSFAVGSRYTYHATRRLDLTLGNMVGQIDSIAVKIDKYDLDPGINNTALKNGVIAEYNTGWKPKWWGEKISIRAGYANTELLGTRLYMNNYSEIFADIGTLKDTDAPFYKQIRLGVTATFGSGYSAASFAFGYEF